MAQVHSLTAFDRQHPSGRREHDQPAPGIGDIQIRANLTAIVLKHLGRGCDIAFPVDHHERLARGGKGDGVGDAGGRFFMIRQRR